MSETVLNGDLTGPIDVSAGGDWVLAPQATLTGGEYYGITSFGEKTADLNLVVKGVIDGNFAGVTVSNYGSAPFVQKVTIAENAQVSAEWGMQYFDTTLAEFLNRGTITADRYGMNFDQSSGVIRNAGAISGETVALRLYESIDSEIINTGQLLQTGEGVALLAVYADNLVLRNTGEIRGQKAALEASFTDTATLYNKGLISSDTGVGFHSGQSLDVSFRNFGTVSGETSAVQINGTELDLVNKGVISSAETAFKLYGFTANIHETQIDAARIANSGTITAPQIFDVSDFEIVLVNSGRITGEMTMSSGGDKIINSGHINGDVDLGGGADTYRANAQGHVTGKVSGGAGEDRLTGAEMNDRLHGGVDDDLVSGRGGNDWLWGDTGDDAIHGGEGDDHLIGGAGNDMLNGGAGRDTFVFGANAGSDRIAGFEKGRDSIQIFGHSGGFAALSLETVGTHLRVIHDGGDILLFNQAAQPLDALDFLFS